MAETCKGVLSTGEEAVKLATRLFRQLRQVGSREKDVWMRRTNQQTLGLRVFLDGSQGVLEFVQENPVDEVRFAVDPFQCPDMQTVLFDFRADSLIHHTTLRFNFVPATRLLLGRRRHKAWRGPALPCGA